MVSEVVVYEDGFEGAFVCWEGISELEVPEGWRPVWVQGDRPGVNHRPEFKPEQERRRSGRRAAKLFTTHASHDAALAIRAPVDVGRMVHVEAWGATFVQGAGQGLRVGIDPQGGMEFPSERIVWGEWRGQYDEGWEGERFVRLGAEALAEGEWVSVYLHSRSQYAAQTVAAYWDDMRVWQEGEGEEPGPGPGGEGLERIAGALERIAGALEIFVGSGERWERAYERVWGQEALTPGPSPGLPRREVTGEGSEG